MTRRVLLDNNMWAGLSDEHSGPALDRLTERYDITLVVAPSVLMEVLKTPRTDVRDRIVRLLATGPRRKRLRTEAHLQSLEIIDVFRRRRPHVVRRVPDTGVLAHYETLWTKRVYRFATTEPEAAHLEALRLEHRVQSQFEAQLENRAALVGSGVAGHDLTDAVLELPELSAAPDWGGWDGRRVPFWRLGMRDHLRLDLLAPRARGLLGAPKSTFADWVGAYVSLDHLARDPHGFSRLWLEEVEAAEVVRSWIRWTLQSVQLGRKVSYGNPVDEQHATHLPDCDVFLTRDKAYASLLGVVAKAAPHPVGQVRLVPHDSSRRVIDVMEHVLQTS